MSAVSGAPPAAGSPAAQAGAAGAEAHAVTRTRGTGHNRLLVAAALVLVPCLLVVGTGALLLALRTQGFIVGYEAWARSLLAVLGLLVVADVVVALVVVIRGRANQAMWLPTASVAATPGRLWGVTSLRTRSFAVIAIVVLVPSVCLASFGVWTYFKSWQRAEVLYEGQAGYRASILRTEIDGLSSSPARFSSAERAQLSAAIVAQFAGQPDGAVQTTLTDIRNGLSLPLWMLRSLERRGYVMAYGNRPVAFSQANTVAWIAPGGVVLVYSPGWSGPPARFSPEVPTGRLIRLGVIGLVLTALLGLLGAWILSRSVVRPVRRLAVASGRLAEGEAGVTVPPTGPRELRDLAVAFNDMNAKMTKAQETEQSFLLSVSHELKTPLTSIRGYAEALDDGALPDGEAAAVIENESARLERLVGDLLESARMRKSAFTVRSETVDLAEVAREVARRYEGAARDAGLALNLEIAPGSLATADHDRVLQVVSNLVENAVRCTPAPGSVKVGTAPGLVCVADSGRGLTSDDLPHAFERFYLYSRYGHDRPVGTGLGLAIVKELTEAMGGAVRISSALGVGTAFFVELPIAASEPGSGPEEAGAEPAAGSHPVSTIESEPADPAALAPDDDVTLVSKGDGE